MIKFIEALGRGLIRFVEEFGLVMFLFLATLVWMLRPPLRIRAIFKQMEFVGVNSLLVVILTGMFTGGVLAFQAYHGFRLFSAESLVGSTVALAMTRELGPVLTSLMVTGRAGSAMAAELGIMRITEQIDALKTMDINPIRFLVSPKLAGALISMPLLTAMADVVGIIGGYLTGVLLLGIDSGIYFARINSSVQLSDVTGGFIKSLVFAIVIVTVCCFKGFYTHEGLEFGAKGVSISTTSAVVLSSVLILISNYIMTSLLL